MKAGIRPEIAILFLLLSSLAFSFSIYFGIRIYSSLPKNLKLQSLRFLGAFLILFSLFLGIFIISDRKETCLACHAVNALEAPHEKVQCVYCHAEKGIAGRLIFKAKQVKMFLSFRKYRLGDSFMCLPNSKCLQCHAKDIGGTVKGKNVKVRHLDFLSERCLKCHESEVHAVFEASETRMSKCLTCHNTIRAASNCSFCHLKPQKITAYVNNLGLTHSSKFISNHGFYPTGVCTPCHETSSCASCHPSYPHDSGFKPRHGEEALRNVMECRKCHLISRCNNCHGTEMPHGENWIAEHRTKAIIDWKTVCSRCHTQQSCFKCHSENTNKKIKSVMGIE